MKKTNINKNVLQYSVFGGISAIIIVVLIFVLIKVKDNKAEEQRKKAEGINISKKQQSLLCDAVMNEVAVDYVEFYNCGEDKVDISGYTLSVNGAVSNTFEENTIIEPGKIFAVDLSILLNNDDNDLIVFSNSDGKVLETCYVPYMDASIAYGRVTNGDNDFSFIGKSKGHDNTEINICYVDRPVFSVPSGFYDDEFELTIYAPEKYSIYYTLDGSTPTVASSLYDGPITIKDVSKNANEYSTYRDVSDYTINVPAQKIDKCTVIKAVAISNSGSRSEVVSASYFVGLSDKKTYQDIPIISIMADPTELFDYYDGIYVTGKSYDDAIVSGGDTNGAANYYQDLIASATIEYYEPDKYLSYKENADLKTYKDLMINAAHKSLQVSGFDKLPNDGSSINQYTNDTSWVLSNGAEDFSTLVRKSYLNEMLKDTNIVTLDTQLSAVFLDGEYWGVYNIDEEFNCDFVVDNYGISADNVAIAKGGFITEGVIDANEFLNVYNYISNNDMANAELYANVANMIDFESYVDCYIAQIYSGNNLYSTINSLAWRSINVVDGEYGDGKWRWVFEPSQLSTGAVEESAYTMDTFLSQAITQDSCFKSLLNNLEFRKMFLMKFLEFSKTIYSVENINRAYDEVVSKYKYNMGAHFARYYFNGDYNTFTTNALVIKEFCENRKYYICNGMIGYLGIKDLYSVFRIRVNSNDNYTLKVNGEEVLTDSNNIWTECMHTGDELDISLEVSGNSRFDSWTVHKTQYEGSLKEPNITVKLIGARPKIEANVSNKN